MAWIYQRLLIGNGICNIKNKIIIFISIILIIVNILLILSVSTNDVLKEEYIENEINKTSVHDLIYSEKFDSSDLIKKVRKHLDTIYSISDVLDIDINSIVESNVFKEVLAKIYLNVINSIKDNNNIPLFNIEDYNDITSKNIDLVLEDKNIKLSITQKNLLVSTLEKIGIKILKDIPDTNSVTKSIPKYKYNTIHFITNNNVRNILITLDIIFLLILIVTRHSINVLKDIFRISIVLIVSLVVINVYLNIYSSRYINEFNFINRMFKYYNYTIFIYELLILVIAITTLFIYNIIKKINA